LRGPAEDLVALQHLNLVQHVDIGALCAAVPPALPELGVRFGEISFIGRDQAHDRNWPGAELSSRARSLHLRRTGHARRSEAHGSLTLSTSRRVPRAARRQSLLGEQQAPARSRLDPPPSGLSRLSGDRPQRGAS